MERLVQARDRFARIAVKMSMRICKFALMGIAAVGLAVNLVSAAPQPGRGGPNGSKPQPKVEARGGVNLHLPRGAVSISVGSSRYHYHRGVYYRRGPSGYVVVRAPLGAIVGDLPFGHVQVVVGGVVYYRYDDIYYRRDPFGYIVVDSPVEIVTANSTGTPSEEPLSDYESVWVEDTEYLFKGGQFFRKTSEGLVWIEAPMDAITKELPDGAVTVWYEEIEYFESDGVFFRKTPEGYRVVAKPWDGGSDLDSVE